MDKLNLTTFIKEVKQNPKDRIVVEVGDSKQPDFKPQQKIMRWDNEVNCSLRLVHDEKNPTVSTVGDKIVWEGDKVKAEIYQLTEGEGGQEFEIILKEKPKSNVVKFTVVDKDVDYFYQPALTEEEIAQGASRPENVEGSYAVYTKTPKINYVGGKEYKCGKIGHIYRPKIIDSVGMSVWGDLHIENGILSVTIPQDFLDTAVYPVRHAAGLTFGYTTIGVSGTTNIAFSTTDISILTGCSFNLSTSGTLDSIKVALSRNSTDTSIDVYAGIYSKDSGGSGVHAKIKGIKNLNANLPVYPNADFVTFNAASDALSPGDYILATAGDGYDISDSSKGVYVSYDNGTGVKSFYSSGGSSTSIDTLIGYDPWNDAASSIDRSFSIYATYTAETNYQFNIALI